MIRTDNSLAYRPDIDGLRAVAVSSVVLFHAWPASLPGGFIGVDIFFVISGFLISTIILRDMDRRAFSVAHFYDRRIRRIFPALAAVLLFTLAVGYWVLFRREFWALGLHVAGSSAFFENFVLWGESGYFDVASETKPLLHLWSLAVEEQFYIVWPILLYACSRLKIGGLGPILVLGLLSFAYSVFLSNTDVTAAYYSPLGRFWELMAGSALAYIKLHRPGLLSRFANVQSFAGAAAIVAGLVVINRSSVFPGFWALLPIGGSFLLLSAGPDAWLNRRVLSTRPFVMIGLISYPLYLWHWPLLTYLHIVSPWHGVKLTIAVVALAVVLATLTYQFIEKPFRRSRPASPPPVKRPAWLSKPVMLASTLAVLGATGLAVQTAKLDPRLYAVNIPTQNEWHFLVARPDLWDAKLEMNRMHGERPRQTFFIGDSQLAQYAERLFSVEARDSNAAGVIMSIGGGCVPIKNVFTDNNNQATCWGERERAFSFAESKEPSAVVIGGLWELYFLGKRFYYKDGEKRYALNTPEGRAMGMAMLEQQLRAISASGKKPFLLLGNFILSGNDPVFAANRVGGPVTRPYDERVPVTEQQLALRTELRALAERAGAEVIDPYDALCVGDRCSWATSDGVPIFKDDSHFNPEWAVQHASFIDRTLTAEE